MHEKLILCVISICDLQLKVFLFLLSYFNRKPIIFSVSESANLHILKI